MMGPVFRVIIHAILYQSLYSRDAYAAKLLDYKMVILVELVGIELLRGVENTQVIDLNGDRKG